MSGLHFSVRELRILGTKRYQVRDEGSAHGTFLCVRLSHDTPAVRRVPPGQWVTIPVGWRVMAGNTIARWYA